MGSFDQFLRLLIFFKISLKINVYYLKYRWYTDQLDFLNYVKN